MKSRFALSFLFFSTILLGGTNFPYKISEHQLSNGLKVIAIPFPAKDVVAFYTIVRVGSRNEIEPGRTGFAHFFEHMMFKGTPNISQNDYQLILKKYGIESSAATWDDRTVYSNVAAKDALPHIAEIESDRFKNLTYTEDEYRNESGAIYGEYLKNLTNPSYLLYRKIQETAFTDHPYNHSVIGKEEDIKTLPEYYNYSLEFYQRFYRPDNTIILVMGDIEPNNVFSILEKYYADWESGFTETEIPADSEQTEERKLHLTWQNPISPYLAVGIKTGSFEQSPKEYAALDLITKIVFSEQSPFYRKMVLQLNRVTQISTDFTPHRDPFLMIFILNLTGTEHYRSVLKEINDTMNELTGRQVDSEYFQMIKSNQHYSMARNLTNLKRTAQLLSEIIAVTGSANQFVEYLDAYEKLTTVDIMNTAGKYFKDENRSVIMLDSESSVGQ